LFGNPPDSKLTLILAGAILVFFVGKSVFTLWFRWWMLGFVSDQTAATAVELFRRYLHAPYAMHLRRNTADSLRRLNDAINQAYLDTLTGAMTAASDMAPVFGIVVVLLIYRPLATVVAVVYFVGVGYVFQRWVKRRAIAAGEELMDAIGEANRFAIEGFAAIKLIKTWHVHPYFIDQYERGMDRESHANRVQQMMTTSPKYFLELIFMVGIAIMSVFVFSGGNKTAGAATLGLFVAAGFRILPNVIRALAAITVMRVSQQGLTLVLEDLDAFDPVPAESTPAALPQPDLLHDELELVGLEFRYPDADHNVVDGIDLSVPAGTSLAIVGASGAGKTTLVDIVLGLHTPTAGRMLVDGVDADDIAAPWQTSIGFVPQDVYPLDTTLRSNVAFGEPADRVDPGRLAEAMSLAQLDELLADLPDGFETRVGERGSRLSGGQRQRVGIARALYRRPRLLVLDEATSLLDNETERKITSTIDALRGRLTLIVVAHRLSTVRHCDQIAFMADGRIEAKGTFEEVRAQSPAFARLVDLGMLEPRRALGTDHAGSALEPSAGDEGETSHLVDI
ncbi:MAG: ABC transporter ATP-binding protein, partial [Actinobacteria bacterium]|nr:ABC transporter ATP-binding protein [Actinomycetota bacterium]